MRLIRGLGFLALTLFIVASSTIGSPVDADESKIRTREPCAEGSDCKEVHCYDCTIPNDPQCETCEISDPDICNQPQCLPI